MIFSASTSSIITFFLQATGYIDFLQFRSIENSVLHPRFTENHLFDVIMTTLHSGSTPFFMGGGDLGVVVILFTLIILFGNFVFDYFSIWNAYVFGISARSKSTKIIIILLLGDFITSFLLSLTCVYILSTSYYMIVGHIFYYDISESSELAWRDILFMFGFGETDFFVGKPALRYFSWQVFITTMITSIWFFVLGFCMLLIDWFRGAKLINRLFEDHIGMKRDDGWFFGALGVAGISIIFWLWLFLKIK